MRDADLEGRWDADVERDREGAARAWRSSTEWAADNRAMGTRKGEQLT